MNTKTAQKQAISKKENKMNESGSNANELVKISVLGVGLTNETEENILEYIVKNIPQQQKSYYIVTPNPEMIVLANKDNAFKRTLNNAKIALTDGMQLYRYARGIGIPLKERIIGTNFVENLCEKVANRPITVGFLGGRGKIAEMAAECLREKYPGLKIAFATAEWNEDFKGSDVDILFVAFGFPKQENWMAEHVGKTNAKVMMGVGGALDQIVDPTLRPPKLVHNLGLGWLYRLVREPWRITRQAKLIEFILLTMKHA